MNNFNSNKIYSLDGQDHRWQMMNWDRTWRKKLKMSCCQWWCYHQHRQEVLKCYLWNGERTGNYRLWKTEIPIWEELCWALWTMLKGLVGYTKLCRVYKTWEGNFGLTNPSGWCIKTYSFRLPLRKAFWTFNCRSDQSYERAMVRTIRIVGALTTGLKVSK